VALNNIKILSVAEKFLYGKFMLPITIKHVLVFVSSACIKFHSIKSSGSCTYMCVDSQTWRS